MITILANLIIPFLVLFLVLYGVITKQEMYQPFLKGVTDGFRIVLEIAPTLIALFLAIEIFRSGGALDLLVTFIKPLGNLLSIPERVLPVIFAKLFSASAATGFLLDVFKNCGPDSIEGLMSSIVLSSTETCFYIISIYYSCIGIKKIRYTLKGALISTFAGVFASVFLCHLLF